MAKMTVREIAGLKPEKKKPYKKAVDTGLLIRVAVSGVKSWIVTYVVDGVQRDYPLSRPWGESTDDGHLSLADARTESEKIRALAREGIDYKVMLEQIRIAEAKRKADEVSAEAARQLQHNAENLTVTDLFNAWVPDTMRKDKGTELRRLFERDVLPIVGAIPLKSLTESDMREVLNSVVERGSNRMAVLLLSDLKQMFRWAEKRKTWRKLIEENPVALLEAHRITSDDYEGSERNRALSVEEIKELSIRLPDAGLLKRTEIAMWIMLSCCCRIGEIIKAKWEHVDFENATWTIPKENAKNKITHKVFLSDFAISYFHQLRELSRSSAWCYPDASGTTHVCIKSTTKQIRDRQLTAVGRKPMSNRSKRADALILSGGDWVPHDLRRTGSTMLQTLGVTPDVIERVLNHVEPNKLKRTYQTYDYANEKREAWRLLGDRLSLILNPADNVVTLQRKA